MSTVLKIKNGLDEWVEIPAIIGPQGADAYVHIRYAAAQPDSNDDILTTPNEWIGIYSGPSSVAPPTYDSYSWYKIKGETGDIGAADSDDITEGTVNLYYTEARKAEMQDQVDALNDTSTYEATSLIINGDLSNGTTGWSQGYGVLSALDNELIYTISGLSASARIEQSFVATVGDKYYLRGDILPLYANSTYLQIGGTSSLPALAVAGEWNTFSRIVVATTTNIFRFYHRTDTNYSIGDVIKFRRLFGLNLSAVFGTGNEPTDPADMDDVIAHFPNSWFDGPCDISLNPNVMEAIARDYTEAREADVQRQLDLITEATSFVGENLVEDGDFPDDTTKWIALNGTGSIVNGVYTLTGTGESSAVSLDQQTSKPAVDGHKIFIRFKGTVSNSSCLKIRYELYGATGGIQADYKVSPVNGVVYDFGIIVTLGTGYTGNLKIRTQHTYADAATANGKKLTLEYFTAIDLTERYGSAIAAQIDSYLSAYPNSWFDGSVQSNHMHEIGNVNGLPTVLDGKSDTTHDHDSDYADIAHNHDTVYASLNIGMVTVSDNVTLGTSHANKMSLCTNAAAATITVPPNATTAFAIGTSIVINRTGAGAVTFAAGSGVTIHSKDAVLTLANQYTMATLIKTDTDVWSLVGDLS